MNQPQKNINQPPLLWWDRRELAHEECKRSLEKCLKSLDSSRSHILNSSTIDQKGIADVKRRMHADVEKCGDEIKRRIIQLLEDELRRSTLTREKGLP